MQIFFFFMRSRGINMNRYVAYFVGLSILSLSSMAKNASNIADTIIVNGNVYTADPTNRFAQAIAILDGDIIFVGATNEVLKLADDKTVVIDAKGKQVLPGFIDNHNHVFEAASEAGGNCELSPEATAKEQLPLLKLCKQEAEPNQWVIGWGHTIDFTLDENSKFTPLEVIDSVFTQQPVIIMEQTSHSMWVNSVALKLAGIDKYTSDPQGGKIMRDEDTGELLGILIDNAGDIVIEQAWNSLNNKFAKSYDGLLYGLHKSSQNGITTIGDGRLYWKRGWYEVWKAVESDEKLKVRVSLRPWIYPHIAKEEQLAFLRKVYNSDKQSLIIVDQVKMYSDGIIINGSAKLILPYKFTYFPDSPYGFNYIPQKQMGSWLTSLDKIGYGAHVHAIGDGAVRETLNAIEVARKAGSKQIYNMTHIEMVDKADINRFKTLEVDADYQIGSEYIGNSEHDWAIPFIGEKRSHNLMPLRQLYDSGANITLSSDWNVNPLSPLAGIANAIKLKDNGLPNLEAAIDAYTINASKALGLTHITGSIEVGKSADIVVLDRNILDKKASEITNAKVTHTILKGEVVYRQ
jgi:predicted amidohydrolase YtcJ